jgi:hemerythrin-like domain-containing protein
MNQIRARLTRDHEELDALLKRLAEDVESPSKGELAATWAAFESRLIRHLELEERLLLPLLEASHPGEVKRTRADHAHIRDAIAELGIAIDLHAAREPHITELIQFLRAHAKHEDEALYSLAGDQAPRHIEHGILEDLKQAVLSVARELGPERRARP